MVRLQAWPVLQDVMLRLLDVQNSALLIEALTGLTVGLMPGLLP
jgi:hypothetical protein